MKDKQRDCMECEFHQLSGIYVCIEAENPEADNSKGRCKLFQPKAFLPGEESEDYVEEEARALYYRKDYYTQKQFMDFIATIATIVRNCKPKVSRIELSNLAPDILDSITTSRVVGLIEVFLKSKDIEVEK